MSLDEPVSALPEFPAAKGRHNARSRGPRTPAGKRRSSLNRLKRGLCPPWVMRDLLARGEDPERFRHLHRELIAWLQPDDARTRVVVETLAETWWEKRRRMRNWVGAGAPDTREADNRVDDLLQRFVGGMRVRNRKWRYRLESVFGPALYAPSILRRRMEERLPSLGGKAPARKRLSWRARLRREGTGRDPSRQFESNRSGCWLGLRN